MRRPLTAMIARFRPRPASKREPPSTTAVVRVVSAPPSVPLASANGSEPNWQRYRLESRHEIMPFISSTQGLEVGEVTFLDDGSVVLGSRIFPGGAEIINHKLGGCVANRGAGSKQLLAIDRPLGETFFYCFQQGIWYRFVPAAGQRNIILQTLGEQVRQFRFLVPLVWLRQILVGAFVLALTLVVAFFIFIVIAWAGT